MWSAAKTVPLGEDSCEKWAPRPESRPLQPLQRRRSVWRASTRRGAAANERAVCVPSGSRAPCVQTHWALRGRGGRRGGGGGGGEVGTRVSVFACSQTPRSTGGGSEPDWLGFLDGEKKKRKRKTPDRRITSTHREEFSSVCFIYVAPSPAAMRLFLFLF